MSLQTTIKNTQDELILLKQLITEKQEKGELNVEQYSHKEQVEMNLNLAYTLSSLYYTYLKVNAIDTQTHPILNEIARIQTAFTKYSQTSQNTINNEEQSRSALSMDKQAANRLIKANLKSLEKNDQYIKKQQNLIVEPQDFSKRLEMPKIEQKNLDIWVKEDKDANKNIKQKMIRGNLIPQTGHLNWKQEIEKLVKK